MNGKPMQVKVASIGPNVFRVETKLREDRLPTDESSEMEVQWNLMCGKSKGEVSSLCVVEGQ